jgi:hypothetical protein
VPELRSGAQLESQIKPMKQYEPRWLWKALLAAATSAICISFLLGCFYPYLFVLMDADQSSGVYRTLNFASLMASIELGFVIAMMTIPAVVALTWGVGWPVFRQFIRRGYSGVAAYTIGGVFVAGIGIIVMAAAHTVGGFLMDGDFRFAILLITVSGPVAGLVVWCVLQRAAQQRSP